MIENNFPRPSHCVSMILDHHRDLPYRRVSFSILNNGVPFDDQYSGTGE